MLVKESLSKSLDWMQQFEAKHRYLERKSSVSQDTLSLSDNVPLLDYDFKISVLVKFYYLHRRKLIHEYNMEQ